MFEYSQSGEFLFPSEQTTGMYWVSQAQSIPGMGQGFGVGFLA